jgi:hypothetical protein
MPDWGRCLPFQTRLLLQLTKRGFEGDAAVRASLAVIEEAK